MRTTPLALSLRAPHQTAQGMACWAWPASMVVLLLLLPARGGRCLREGSALHASNRHAVVACLCHPPEQLHLMPLPLLLPHTGAPPTHAPCVRACHSLPRTPPPTQRQPPHQALLLLVTATHPFARWDEGGSSGRRTEKPHVRAPATFWACWAVCKPELLHGRAAAALLRQLEDE